MFYFCKIFENMLKEKDKTQKSRLKCVSYDSGKVIHRRVDSTRNFRYRDEYQVLVYYSVLLYHMDFRDYCDM